MSEFNLLILYHLSLEQILQQKIRTNSEKTASPAVGILAFSLPNNLVLEL